ncbi:histidine kinase [Paraflavisolibacter sp. H34]|uniref:sensor histidine kinase n=1 Tax=Huijunlia imazamoxiresistens TaxID=3127457 RepID=UPI003019CBD4
MLKNPFIKPFRDLTEEHKAINKFRLVYVVALAAIAVVSVVRFSLILNYLSSRNTDAHLVNYASRLRTYSQTLAKTALLLEKGTDGEDYRKEFITTFKQWQKLHHNLLNGSDFQDLPAPDKEELRHMYGAIEEPYQNIADACSHIADELRPGRSPDKARLQAQVQKILDNEKPYLMTMELIVFDYDRFSQNNVNRLKTMEYWMLAFILLALLVVAVFIFQPLVQKIRRMVLGLAQSEANARGLAGELQEANESLEASLKELRETSFALEKATYLVKTDAQGAILYANDKYCHVTRYSMSELLNKPLFYNSFGEGESIIYQHIRDPLRRREVWQGEVFDHASDGTGFWLDVTLMPIIDNKGKLYQYLVVSNDITRRKQTEQKLQQVMEEQLRIKSMEQKVKSHAILAGQERERKRVAAEIHDGIGQMLTSLRMRLEMFIHRHPGSEKDMNEVHQLLQTIIMETRRIIANLLPSVLDDFGLKAAIRELIKRVEEGSGIVFTLEEHLDLPILEKEVELTIFRILQESLNNAVKHSGTDVVEVHLFNDSKKLILQVEDYGKGFDFDEATLYRSEGAGSHGLHIMKERASLVGGELKITSGKDSGTTIQLEIAL